MDVGAKICVSDVGHKPTPERQRLAFARFEQLNNCTLSTKAKYSVEKEDRGVVHIYTKTVVEER